MWRSCTICVVKTKALISSAVTMQLICTFVFAYAKSRSSLDAAHLMSYLRFRMATDNELGTSATDTRNMFKYRLPDSWGTSNCIPK